MTNELASNEFNDDLMSFDDASVITGEINDSFELVHKFKDEDVNDIVISDSHIPDIDDLLFGDFSSYTDECLIPVGQEVNDKYTFPAGQEDKYDLKEEEFHFFEENEAMGIDKDGSALSNDSSWFEKCGDYVKLTSSILLGGQGKTEAIGNEKAVAVAGSSAAAALEHPSSAIVDYDFSRDTISRLRGNSDILELPFASKKNRFIRIKYNNDARCFISTK